MSWLVSPRPRDIKESQRGKGGSIAVLRGKEMEEALEEHQGIETKRWGGQFVPGLRVHES